MPWWTAKAVLHCTTASFRNNSRNGSSTVLAARNTSRPFTDYTFTDDDTTRPSWSVIARYDNEVDARALLTRGVALLADNRVVDPSRCYLLRSNADEWSESVVEHWTKQGSTVVRVV